MSSALYGFIGHQDDPREIEFVRNVQAKTKEGKILWTRQGTAFTATIPGNITVNFVLATTLGGAPDWQLFTARDKQGQELVRVSSTGAVSFLLGTVDKYSLLAATNDLFVTVRGTTADDLDKAIDALKRL